MTVDRLENQAGILRIVLSLDGEGETKISDLIRLTGVTQNPVYRSIYQLTVMEWIEEDRLKEFPFTRTFYLTDKGKKAAKVIKQLEKLTDSPLDSEPQRTVYVDGDEVVKVEILDRSGWTLEKVKKGKYPEDILYSGPPVYE